MKSYDCYLFDWDGCLARSLQAWLECYKLTYADYGLNPSDNDISTRFGNWEAPLELGVTDLAAFNAAHLERLQPKLQTVTLYPGALEILAHLKAKGVKLGVVSSSRHVDLDAALAHNGLSEVFEIVLGAEDVTHHKPDPEVVQLAMRRFDAEPEQTVIIGDSKADLDAARAASIDSVLIYPPEHVQFYDLEELKTHDPTYIVHSFDELQEQLV